MILAMAIIEVASTADRQDVTVGAKGQVISVENSYIRINYDLGRGTYSAIDKRNNSVCISEAVTRVGVLGSSDPGFLHVWQEESVKDSLGRGQTLRITSSKAGLPSIILEISLYANKKFMVLAAGVDNTTDYPIQVKSIHPATAKAFAGFDLDSDFKMLDGNGGGEWTRVTSENTIRCRNNLMVTFGKPGARRSLVVGGLTYRDFEKFARASNDSKPDPGAEASSEKFLRIDVWSEDPVGKLVEPGSRYIPDDRYFMNFAEDNPFAALEEYGFAMRAAQPIKLNVYEFPSVCLWYVSVPEYGGGPAINDSTGAVWEIEQAAKRGFLKYSPVAIRLVPDNYDVNNEQGWWDDAHFQRLGEASLIIGPHYKSPYETTKKWGEAVTARGGIPLLYVQTARRSEDYCLQFPGHLLFNSPFVRFTRHPEGREIWWYRDSMPLWGYDFTDPGFIRHMREVYADFKNGGIRGLMYDYPSTGWAFDGGFEDPYATTASAYRNIFKLAYEGLGENCFLDERNLGRGSDVTLGWVASQRVWGDTDRINPAMITRCGLRWYKNRVVVSYDMDAKNPFHGVPDNLDGVRSMFTMAYVVSGRLLLGASFSKMTDEQLYILSRVFPYHKEPKSARPVDAFSGGDLPQVYDFEVNPQWHQVTFFNTTYDSPEWKKAADGSKLEPMGKPIAATIGVDLGKNTAWGGLGLNPSKKYYIFDYWNDRLVGIFPGSARLEQALRPGEARMMSVHEAEDRPQFLSTNRHIMQGYADLPRCEWDGNKRELRGTSKVIGGETYKVVIAINGWRPKAANAAGAKGNVRVIEAKAGLAELSLDRAQNGDTKWTISFDK